VNEVTLSGWRATHFKSGAEAQPDSEMSAIIKMEAGLKFIAREVV